MIYGIAIYALTIVVDLFTDVRLWYKDQKVNHFRGAALRLIGLIPACWLIGWAVIPLALFLYWILFEGMYNVLIGQKWWYIGETAKIDKLQRKYPAIKILKYVLLIFSILFYAWNK